MIQNKPQHQYEGQSTNFLGSSTVSNGNIQKQQIIFNNTKINQNPNSNSTLTYNPPGTYKQVLRTNPAASGYNYTPLSFKASGQTQNNQMVQNVQ